MDYTLTDKAITESKRINLIYKITEVMYKIYRMNF